MKRAILRTILFAITPVLDWMPLSALSGWVATAEYGDYFNAHIC